MRCLVLAVFPGIIFGVPGTLVSAAPLRPGDPAPEFRLLTGERQVQLADFRGRVLVMTCEDRHHTNTNQAFKDAVTAWLIRHPGLAAHVAVVPVISCFQYFGPVRGVCIKQVRRNARRLGRQLYVDAQGEMFRDWGLSHDRPAVIVLDRGGIVQFFGQGRLSPDQVSDALTRLEKAARAGSSDPR